MIDLGRNDIITKVTLLSSHLALPREGHLESSSACYGPCWSEIQSQMVYDPSNPEIDHCKFKECDWSEFYRDAKQAISINAPEP